MSSLLVGRCNRRKKYEDTTEKDDDEPLSKYFHDEKNEKNV